MESVKQDEIDLVEITPPLADVAFENEEEDVVEDIPFAQDELPFLNLTFPITSEKDFSFLSQIIHPSIFQLGPSYKTYESQGGVDIYGSYIDGPTPFYSSRKGKVYRFEMKILSKSSREVFDIFNSDAAFRVLWDDEKDLSKIPFAPKMHTLLGPVVNEGVTYSLVQVDWKIPVFAKRQIVMSKISDPANKTLIHMSCNSPFVKGSNRYDVESHPGEKGEVRGAYFKMFKIHEDPRNARGCILEIVSYMDACGKVPMKVSNGICKGILESHIESIKKHLCKDESTKKKRWSRGRRSS